MERLRAVAVRACVLPRPQGWSRTDGAYRSAQSRSAPSRRMATGTGLLGRHESVLGEVVEGGRVDNPAGESGVVAPEPDELRRLGRCQDGSGSSTPCGSEGSKPSRW